MQIYIVILNKLARGLPKSEFCLHVKGRKMTVQKHTEKNENYAIVIQGQPQKVLKRFHNLIWLFQFL